MRWKRNSFENFRQTNSNTAMIDKYKKFSSYSVLSEIEGSIIFIKVPAVCYCDVASLFMLFLRIKLKDWCWNLYNSIGHTCRFQSQFNYKSFGGEKK